MLNTPMSTFAERVRESRLALGLKQDQLANLSGLKQPDISKIELGRIQQTTEILNLARALKVSPDWLATGKGPKEPQNVPRMALGGIFPSPAIIEMEGNPDYPAVRRVSVKAQAGVTGYAVEDIEDGPPIVFRADWYTSRNFIPKKMLAMRVHGESMMPSLYPGDLIVMNTAQVQPKDGIAFVVAYEGEVVVKRMVRDDGSWWLCSDNPDQRRYPRKKCNGDTQIIGEVVYRQTERI